MQSRCPEPSSQPKSPSDAGGRREPGTNSLILFSSFQSLAGFPQPKAKGTELGHAFWEGVGRGGEGGGRRLEHLLQTELPTPS